MSKRIFAYCGILAAVVFIVCLIIFSLLTPGYSNLTDAVSELGTPDAPYAVAWNLVGLVLAGLLVTAFAWGLHLDLFPSMGAMVVPILVGLSGLGLAGAGLFPAEAGFEPSPRTTLHYVMVAINLLPFILVTFIFAIGLKTNEYWKKWVFFSVAMGFFEIASFFIPRSIPAGLIQRLGLGAYFLWLFVISSALLRKQLNPHLRNSPQ